MSGRKKRLRTWRRLDRHAAKLRHQLGLTPIGYAKIARDMGVASAQEQTGSGLVQRRAQRMHDDLLASENCPDHLRAPVFQRAVFDWARAEAMAQMAWEWAERFRSEGEISD